MNISECFITFHYPQEPVQEAGSQTAEEEHVWQGGGQHGVLPSGEGASMQL